MKFEHSHLHVAAVFKVFCSIFFTLSVLNRTLLFGKLMFPQVKRTVGSLSRKKILQEQTKTSHLFWNNKIKKKIYKQKNTIIKFRRNER